MTTAELAAKLIHVFEGCKLTAYQDAVGIWTIGFGHTLGVQSGQTITQEQADQFLETDAAPLLLAVKDRPMLEAAALVSFGYNCGMGALKRVLSGQANLVDFNKAGGKVLAGLTARRNLEQSLIEVSKGG